MHITAAWEDITSNGKNALFCLIQSSLAEKKRILEKCWLTPNHRNVD